MLSSFEYIEFTEALAVRRRDVQGDSLRIRERGGAPDRAPVLLEATSTLLERTLEDLAAAEEELRSQNEALFAARVEAEASASHFQRLFDFAPSGYLVTDAAAKILQVNAAAADLLGQAVNAIVGRLVISYVDAVDRRGFRAALTRAQESDGIEEWPIRMTPAPGRSRELLVTTRVARSPDATCLMYWMLRDDTGRQLADLL